MPTHSKEAKKWQKEEEVMAAAILQKEKEAAEKHKQNKAQKAANNPPTATKVGTTSKNQPSVHPPLPILLAATKASANDTGIKLQAKDTVKSPTTTKSKIVKSSNDDQGSQARP